MRHRKRQPPEAIAVDPTLFNRARAELTEIGKAVNAWMSDRPNFWVAAKRWRDELEAAVRDGMEPDELEEYREEGGPRNLDCIQLLVTLQLMEHEQEFHKRIGPSQRDFNDYYRQVAHRVMERENDDPHLVSETLRAEHHDRR